MPICPAPDCSLQIAHAMLMCKHHWSLVPRPIQQEVWKHHKATRTSEGLLAHATACADAVIAVAQIEGTTVPTDNPWIMRRDRLTERARVRAAEQAVEAQRFGGDREDD